MTDAGLIDAWLSIDPDPATRRAIEAGRSGSEWVREHFGSVLRFGTAGLRATSGPGPARMNRVMAQVAARAVGAELIGGGLSSRGAVVGFDARPGSADMALDAARMLAGMGVPTAIIDGPAPTPLLAHQLLVRSAGAGLMITASHNHRDDNGLKVYWADGTQIRPPIDQRIEARMDLSRLPDDGDLAAPHEIESLEVRAVIASYVGAVVRGPTFGPDGTPEDPRDAPPIVYTALCGVGSQCLAHAFAAAGLAPPIYVEHQRHPDGSFPGLPFPNPEEPGVLDDAISVAVDKGVDLVLANDPDADRLAVAVRDRGQVRPGGVRHGQVWHRLSGDELGVLLCDWLIGLRVGPEGVDAGVDTGVDAGVDAGVDTGIGTEVDAGVDAGVDTGAPLISASSVVSGRMVDALCAARGVAHYRTLTGFKWIMEPRLAHPEADWLFGYEEALGYSVTDAVLDKDGISAAVEFVRLAGALAGRGIGPLERLDELASEVGLHVTSAASVRASPEAIASTMAAVRANPPASISGSRVIKFTDWLSDATTHSADLVEFELVPAGDGGGGGGLDLALPDGGVSEIEFRVCIRPSGTEPKAKIYLEAVYLGAEMGSPADIRAERRRLGELLEAMSDEVSSWFDRPQSTSAASEVSGI